MLKIKEIKTVLPKFNDCSALRDFRNAEGQYFVLSISTITDSVYLFDMAGGENSKINIEFSSGGEVFAIADDYKSKTQLGYFTTPQGKKWGSSLEFVPERMCKFKMGIGEPHVEIYIELEKKLCGFLVQDKNPQVLKDFMSANWDKFPKVD